MSAVLGLALRRTATYLSEYTREKPSIIGLRATTRDRFGAYFTSLYYLMSWISPDDPRIVLPHLTLQTVVGISVSIAGNVLISLALNLQKLAHLRLDRRQNSLPDAEREGRPPGRDMNTRSTNHPESAVRFCAAQQALEEDHQFETQPLIPKRSPSQSPSSSYGLAQYSVPIAGDDSRSRKSSNAARARRHQRKPSFASHFLPLRLVLGADSSSAGADSSTLLVGDVFPQRSTRTNHHDNRKVSSGNTTKDGKESDYLRSKIWFVVPNS